jgi:protein SCO1/2
MRCFVDRYRPIAVLAPLALLAAARARGQEPSVRDDTARPATIVERVGFDQRLGEKIPLDLPLRDEAGRSVRLRDYFGRRPVLLNLVYYRCPMLCGQELTSLVRSLRAMSATAGSNFEVVTVSFDPSEPPALAAAKKRSVLDEYDRPRAGEGWHFLTGPAESIAALARSVGFRYTPIAGTRQFAHAAGLVVLAPDGTITRYFLGLDYPAKDVQASVEQAAAGRVGSPVGRLLLLCYDYDPATGRYTLAVQRVIRVLGVATALGLATLVGTLIWRERRKARLAKPEPVAPAELVATADRIEAEV